ncbi:MAG: hypothetical protein IKB68_06445 [Rikenellaceae bacterium]|nr:hypothetical protein [Rikenellaceae bacterium]
MKLTLFRKYKKERYTIGNLYVDGRYFCDTLEDVVRDRNDDGDLNDVGEAKVYGETAIPRGVYKVVVNLSNTFKRRLPLLLDVPHFVGIRIHRGNSVRDTSGCILVGENKMRGMVINSTKYELRLTDLLERAQERNEPIEIEIV